jgi:membrane AbrB-like protein
MERRGWLSELGQGLVLLAVGALGAVVGHALGLIAGVIAGALVATGIYRLLGGEPGPWRARYGRVGRLLLGTVIGATFGSDLLAPLQAALLPMLGLVGIVLAVGLLLGWALFHFTRLDSTTAIMSALPGGLPAMAALSEEVDADATVVSAIHFSRLTTILLLVPLLIPLLTGLTGGSSLAPVPEEPVGLASSLAALALGVTGGLLALKLGIPTGDMVGPILVVGGANLVGADLGPLPTPFRHAAMLFIGTSVGAQVSIDSLRKLRQVLIPAAAVIAVLIGVGLFLGWGLSELTPLDPVTALLCGVPGGASTMPVIAHELGGDIRLVAALQLTRQLVMLVLIPPALGYLVRSWRQRRLVTPKP